MFPNFIILGSTKCASSSLHYYLNQHPEISMSTVKETGFFSLQFANGMDYYQQYFKNVTTEKAIGETTPTYCFLPYVAPRIKEHFPDIKLILCFRNPIDRAFSSWLMKTGIGKESMSFRQSMDVSKKMLDYTKEIFASDEGERYWINNNKNYSEEEKRPRTYIIAGQYAEMLKLYKQYFRDDQIKIIFFDDVHKNLDSTLAGVYNYLGVDSSFSIPKKEGINYQIDRKANKLVYKLVGPAAGRFLIGLIPKSLKTKLRKPLKAKEPPKLTNEERLYYWEMFKDDVAALEKMLDKNLSHWNPANEKKIVSVEK